MVAAKSVQNNVAFLVVLIYLELQIWSPGGAICINLNLANRWCSWYQLQILLTASEWLIESVLHFRPTLLYKCNVK